MANHLVLAAIEQGFRFVCWRDTNAADLVTWDVKGQSGRWGHRTAATDDVEWCVLNWQPQIEPDEPAELEKTG